MIAGEASGDLHGAHLVAELRKLAPGTEFYGLGGKNMEREGVRLLYDLTSIAALGLGDVLRQYFKFRKIFYNALNAVFNDIKPDLILLIDYPGFNLRFAKKINKRIPVIYYISPQIWAWGGRRIKTIARVVSKMLVILPFEVDVYKGSGLPCEFVGHPLVEQVKPSKPEAELRREWALGDSKIISILPGSRRSEVERILPVMIDAARILHKDLHGHSFILTESPTLPSELYDKILSGVTLPLKRIRNRTHDAVSVSDAVMVASGTATLETALLLKPFVIVYKTAASTYFLGKRLIQIPYIGLINVLAGKKIVPEFIQHDATGENIAAGIKHLLTDETARKKMIEQILEVKMSLGEGGAAQRTAKAVLSFLPFK